MATAPEAPAPAPPTVAAWQNLVRSLVAPRLADLPPRDVDPAVALGAVLAADVLAPADLPAAPISAMDGFAVRAADLRELLTRGAERVLPVASDLPAALGDVPPLEPGSAVRIMTGAPLPPGADAVIEVERTDAAEHGRAPSTVRIEDLGGLDLGSDPTGKVPGRNVRAVGEEVACGDVLARAGDRVGPGLVGLARTLGIPQLRITAPVLVGVLVTGDELVDAADADAAARTGAVRESNGDMLLAALADLGGPVEPAGARRCSDRPEDLLAALAAMATEVDLILTSGGVGHGAYDVVKAALGPDGNGASRFAHVALRPGGPQGVGVLRAGDREVPMIHLPGTPVGALVGFHLFVRPLLVGDTSARPVRAVVLPAPAEVGEAPRRAPSGRRRRVGMHVLPGRLDRTEDGDLAVVLLPGHRLSPYGRADALVLATGGGVAAGERVQVLPI